MSVGHLERATQDRVIALFRDELGYRYLGDWSDRDGDTKIEEGLLTDWLSKCGYTPAQISEAIYALRTEADNDSRFKLDEYLLKMCRKDARNDRLISRSRMSRIMELPHRTVVGPPAMLRAVWPRTPIKSTNGGLSDTTSP